jgi:hypothetical protein
MKRIDMMIDKIIFINGIYDIICALSILYFNNNYFSNFHIDIFKDEYKKNNVMNRILAYWILTYGIIRIFAIFNNYYLNILIIISYLIEILGFVNEEFFYKTTITYKVSFISFLSLIIILFFINKKF